MKKIAYILTTFFCTTLVSAQYTLKNAEDVQWYNNITQEKLYAHYNSTLLFSGEQLTYKLYCLNSKTNRFTKNSKVAYAELVGENGSVFKHKLLLTNGVGQGDFLIPADIESGHYKLIAYTRWMINGEETHFFEGDINIINPYRKIVFSEGFNSERTNNQSQEKYQQISLEVDASQYGKREKVTLQVKSLNVSNAYGNYSVSVRKMSDADLSHAASKATNFHDTYTGSHTSATKGVGETIWLPEFKGEMLTGKVYNNSTQELVQGVEVGLSILSDEAYQDMTVTNQNGTFYFQIGQKYSSVEAMVQVFGEQRNDYRIDVYQNAGIDYSTLKFNKLVISKEFKDEILKRSVNNQIENSYASSKPDNVVTPSYPKPFYGNYMKTYMLDDYKRFPTVAETLIEVVDDAWHERRNGPQRFINVRERENDPYYQVDILPLLVVDGAMEQDHTRLMNYDANLVESISVLRDEFYYGKQIFQGVLMVNTFDGDYEKLLQGDYIKKFELFESQKNIEYFNQDYAAEVDYTRIPDLRQQLLWNPNFLFQTEEKQIEFYTSDIAGTYEIIFEGFTNSGVPISIKKTFTVK